MAGWGAIRSSKPQNTGRYGLAVSFVHFQSFPEKRLCKDPHAKTIEDTIGIGASIPNDQAMQARVHQVHQTRGLVDIRASHVGSTLSTLHSKPLPGTQKGPFQPRVQANACFFSFHRLGRAGQKEVCLAQSLSQNQNLAL